MTKINLIFVSAMASLALCYAEEFVFLNDDIKNDIMLLHDLAPQEWSSEFKHLYQEIIEGKNAASREQVTHVLQECESLIDPENKLLKKIGTDLKLYGYAINTGELSLTQAEAENSEYITLKRKKNYEVMCRLIIRNALNVMGNATINGTLTVNNLVVTGNQTVNGSITGNVTLSSLTVTGPTTLTSLTTTSTTTVSRLNVTHDTAITGTLTVNGQQIMPTTFASVNSNGAQTINTGDNVLFDGTASTSPGISYDSGTGTFTIAQPGTYQVVTTLGATGPNQFQLFSNSAPYGGLIPNTITGSGTTPGQSNGNFVVNFTNPNSTLSYQNITGSSVTLDQNSGGSGAQSNASLYIQRLS